MILDKALTKWNIGKNIMNITAAASPNQCMKHLYCSVVVICIEKLIGVRQRES